MLKSLGASVSSILSLRKGDWQRTSRFSLLAAVTLFSLTMVEIATISLFLKRFGVDYLPYMYVLSGLCVIPATALYSAALQRWTSDLLFHVLFLGAIGVLVVIGLLIKLDISLLGYSVAFPLLYISFEIIHSLLTSHLGTYLLDYFDTLALKRLNALIYSGARMGSISAAVVASGLLTFVGTEVLLWVAVGSLILASAVVQLIQRTQATLAPAARAAEDEEEESISWRDWSWLRDAPLVWVIAASFFALNLIEWIVDFQTNSLFEQRYPTEEALATFYSTFSAGSDIIGLFLQLFVLSRLIARVGVGLANVIHPAATFLVSGIFTFGHAFIPAIAARFVLMPFSESVQDPTSDLLYNALPRDRRGRTRAFISGVVTPVGTIVGSLLILTLDRWSSTFFLSAAGLFFAGSYLALAFWQRRKYTASLVSLLHTEDIHRDSFAIQELGRLDEEALQVILGFAADANDEVSLLALDLLDRLKDERAREPLAALFTQRSPAVQARLVHYLGGLGDLQDGGQRAFLEGCLRLTQPRVRQEALRVLDARGYFELFEERLQELVLPLLSDHDPLVRSEAIRVLCQSGDLFALAEGINALNAMLRSDDPALKSGGLRVLGMLSNKRFKKQVQVFLDDPHRSVRCAALQALAALEDGGGSSLPEEVKRRLRDPAFEVRHAAVQVVGKIGDERSVSALLELLVEPQTRLGTVAIEALRHLLPAAEERLHAVLRNPASEPNLIYGVVQVLQRSDPKKLRSLCLEVAEAQLLKCYGGVFTQRLLATLPPAPSLELLVKAHQDLVETRLGLVMQILVTIGGEKEVKAVTRTLRSRDAAARADAIETLESLVGPRILRYLAPFLEGLDTDTLLNHAQSILGLQPTVLTLRDVLLEGCEEADSWVRAAAFHAIAELRILPLKVRLYRGMTRERSMFAREVARQALAVCS